MDRSHLDIGGVDATQLRRPEGCCEGSGVGHASRDEFEDESADGTSGLPDCVVNEGCRPGGFASMLGYVYVDADSCARNKFVSLRDFAVSVVG